MDLDCEEESHEELQKASAEWSPTLWRRLAAKTLAQWFFIKESPSSLPHRNPHYHFKLILIHGEEGQGRML